MSTYDILVMDYSSGRAFITTVDKPVEDDFEEYVDAKLTSLDIRMKDCEWMDFTGQEIETL